MEKQQSGNLRRQRNAVSIWEDRRAEILALYVYGPMSQEQLAQHFGCSQQGVAKALKRMGIKPKARGRPGAANGRYKHGREVRIYRTMIEKDSCAACGTSENLCIHHRDRNHYNNTPDNLEVMCMSCHSSMHKAEWWRSRKASAF